MSIRLVIPCQGLVDLYYDIWYCVPCRLAFRVAVKQLHSSAELAEYLMLTETVLVKKSACDDFAARFGDDDDPDEIIFWLISRFFRLSLTKWRSISNSDAALRAST